MPIRAGVLFAAMVFVLCAGRVQADVIEMSGVQRETSGIVNFTGGVTTTVPFNTTTITTGGFSAASGTVATAPAAGVYSVGGNITARLTAGSSGVVDAYVLVNGAVVSRQQYSLPTSGAFDALQIETLVALNPGDVVSVQLRPTSGGSTVQLFSDGYTHVSLSQQQTPIAGIQREIGSDAVLSGGVATAVPFNTTTITTGGLSGSTGTVATATEAGLYNVGANLTARIASGAGVVDAFVVVNGSVVSRQEFTLPSSGDFDTLSMDTLVALQPGDVVSVQVLPQAGMSVELESGGYTHASMVRGDGEIGVLRQFASSSLVLSGSAITDLNFDNTLINVGGFGTSGVSIASVPFDGMYKIGGDLTVRRTSGSGVLDLYLAVNGALHSEFEYLLPSGGTFDSLSFESLALLAPGDVVSLQYHAFGGTFEVSGGQFSPSVHRVKRE